MTAWPSNAYLRSVSTTKNSQNGGPSWPDIVALLAILAFGVIAIGVFHMNAGDVAAISVALGGLFGNWRSRLRGYPAIWANHGAMKTFSSTMSMAASGMPGVFHRSVLGSR